jgi:hypothetical protein
MSSCGCNKQGGGGSKRCSCKKCRRYSQRGGFWPFDSTPTTPTTPTTSQRQSENVFQSNIQPETIEEKKDRLKILCNQSAALEAEIQSSIPSTVTTAGGISGGGGGNMMSMAVYGGYGESDTAQNEANIELDSGPSIATQGLVSQAGGKRKTRKTRRMKKSRKHKKSRKYRR